MVASLEDRVKKLEELVESLQQELAAKEKRLQSQEDMWAIVRLQNAYGYYLEHWMVDEIVDLFADHPDVSATFVEGTYLGVEGVRRYFNRLKDAPPSFLHVVMQVSPVITLSEDGQTAKGRWYGYGIISTEPVNDNIDPLYMGVVYEMEYIKQDGIWKILKLAFQMHYAYQPSQMFVKAPAPEEKEETRFVMNLSPDIWAEYDIQYPSGYIYPFHFKHPVTGKETSEAAYNAKLKLKPNRFRPK